MAGGVRAGTSSLKPLPDAAPLFHHLCKGRCTHMA